MGFFSEILNAVSPAALAYNKTKPQDSSAAANQYLNQIPGMAEKNLSPYIMPGQQSQDFINQIMAGYKPSEGYNFQKNELQKEIGGNAIPGGRRDEEQRGELIQKLLSGDMQQWLQNVTGAHNKSFEASQELNGIQGGVLGQQGALAGGAVENQNQRNDNLRNALMQLAGSAFGFGGGGGFGGGQQQQMNTGASGSQYGNMSQLFNRAPRPSQSTYPGSQFGVR